MRISFKLLITSIIVLSFVLSGCGKVENKDMSLNMPFGTVNGRYTGEVGSNDIPNGQGKFIVSTDPKWTYEGMFKDGKIDGQGKLIMTGKQITKEGSFINGRLNGDGKVTYGNGTQINGTFENDMFYHKSTADKYQVLFPSDWQGVTPMFQMIKLQVMDTDGVTGANITIEDCLIQKDGDEKFWQAHSAEFELMLKRMLNLYDYHSKVIKTAHGYTVHYRKGTANTPKGTLNMYQASILKNYKAYTINFFAPANKDPKFEDTLMTSVNSFKVLE